MSDLRRWSEDGATATERSLLESSRQEHAPARARERVSKALGLAVVASSVTGAATATAMSTRGSVFLLKLLSIPVGGDSERTAGRDSARRPRSCSEQLGPNGRASRSACRGFCRSTLARGASARQSAGGARCTRSERGPAFARPLRRRASRWRARLGGDGAASPSAARQRQSRGSAAARRHLLRGPSRHTVRAPHSGHRS